MAIRSGGGPLRPSLVSTIKNYPGQLSGLALAATLLGMSVTPGTAQPLLRKLRAGAPAPTEREALALLRRMIRPAAEFAGEQVTEVTARGGMTSRLRVKGDRRGRLRCDFLAPENLTDDVMLIAPDSFRHYHARTRALDVALWPTNWNSQERRVIRMVGERMLRVERVGEEVVAGRAAEIVQVTPRRPGPGRFQAKFWIDRDTGIKLKNEISNASGLVSRSYMTSIVVGPDAGVTARDFAPQFPGAQVRTLFPGDAQFESVTAAGDRLPFRPVEPGSLPPNFRLGGVWIVGEEGAREAGRGAILLRYTNGVADFALFQRRLLGRKIAEARQGAIRRGGVYRWQVAQPDGVIDVHYLGHLPVDQVQAIRDSVK